MNELILVHYYYYLKIFIYLFGCAGSYLRHTGCLVVACVIQFLDEGLNLGPLH